MQLVEYSYPNGRRGAYPLDTDENGILSRKAGMYDSGAESSDHADQEEDDDGQDPNEDVIRLA